MINICSAALASAVSLGIKTCWVLWEARGGRDAVFREQPSRQRDNCWFTCRGRTAVSSVGKLEVSERFDAGPLLPSYQSSLSFTSASNAFAAGPV